MNQLRWKMGRQCIVNSCNKMEKWYGTRTKGCFQTAESAVKEVLAFLKAKSPRGPASNGESTILRHNFEPAPRTSRI